MLSKAHAPRFAARAAAAGKAVAPGFDTSGGGIFAPAPPLTRAHETPPPAGLHEVEVGDAGSREDDEDLHSLELMTWRPLALRGGDTHFGELAAGFRCVAAVLPLPPL